jgi:hypothetical protein
VGVVSGVRVLAAGVDSVYASVAEGLAVDRLADGLAHRGQAQDFGEDVPWEIPGTDRTLLVKPRSFRTYNVWLSSPTMDVRIGPDGEHRPPACLELRSAFIHQVGVEAAVEDAERVLGYFFPQLAAVAGGVAPSSPCRPGILSDHLPGRGLRVSRIDVYADVQGWEPTLADHGRFMARAISRRAWEQDAEDRRRQILMEGRTFCGFTFGHGDVVGRIYDKTRLLRKRQERWPEEVWQGHDPDRAVWRLEFQFRRGALTDFRLGEDRVHSVADALAVRQGLWRYATEWLSLRTPVPGDANRWRWPVSPVWRELRAVRLGSPVSGLVRRRVREANHLRLVRGYVGYLTSLAAMGTGEGIDEAVASVTPTAERYLEARGRTFDGVTTHKRERRLAV